MRILGVHDGHTATACLIADGQVEGVVSEERLTQRKGEGGFPFKSTRLLFQEHGLTASDIDAISVVGLVKPLITVAEYKRGRQLIFPYLLRMFPGNPRLLISSFVSLAKR